MSSSTGMSYQITEMILRRLKRMGLKKKEFASLLGVTPSRVTQMLNGDHNFTIETLERIEQVLRISFFDQNVEQNYIPCSPCIVVNFLPT